MRNGKGRLTKGQKALKGLKNLYSMFGCSSHFVKKSCDNCKHYNKGYPSPCCLICRTGHNDDYRKQDYWQEETF